MVKFPHSMVRRSKKKECSTCKKKFADELKLAEHMSIHAGTFTCMMCGEVFLCSGSLKGHIRVHLRERPYHCKCCRKSKSNCGWVGPVLERPYHCNFTNSLNKLKKNPSVQVSRIITNMHVVCYLVKLFQSSLSLHWILTSLAKFCLDILFSLFCWHRFHFNLGNLN